MASLADSRLGDIERALPQLEESVAGRYHSPSPTAQSHGSTFQTCRSFIRARQISYKIDDI
jgi:hypothetical protein